MTFVELHLICQRPTVVNNATVTLTYLRQYDLFEQLTVVALKTVAAQDPSSTPVEHYQLVPE